jgi:hypothetical protein
MPKTATTDGGGAAHDPRGKLADFAEDLGKLLGSTERKATQWLSQRENVAKQLSAIRDKASSLLQQLGSVAGESPLPWRRSKATGRKRGGPPGSTNTQAVAAATATRSTRRRKRKPMSAEARAKIAAAQRARWAKQKKTNNG